MDDTQQSMIQVLTALDHKVDVENWKVLLVLDALHLTQKPSREILKTSSLCLYPKIPLLNYSFVMLVSSEILRLSIASSFWNNLFQGSMSEKRHLKLFRGVIFYSANMGEIDESSIRIDY